MKAKTHKQTMSIPRWNSDVTASFGVCKENLKTETIPCSALEEAHTAEHKFPSALILISKTAASKNLALLSLTFSERESLT
jgi:hypothetical protein